MVVMAYFPRLKYFFFFSFQSERKLWMVTLMLVLVWLISWTPYAMVFLLSATGYRHLISHHVDMLPGKIGTHNCFTGTPFMLDIHYHLTLFMFDNIHYYLTPFILDNIC